MNISGVNNRVLVPLGVFSFEKSIIEGPGGKRA